MTKIYQAIAWMMPKWLCYWCAIRLFSHAITSDRNSEKMIQEVSAWDVLISWAWKEAES